MGAWSRWRVDEGEVSGQVSAVAEAPRTGDGHIYVRVIFNKDLDRDHAFLGAPCGHRKRVPMSVCGTARIEKGKVVMSGSRVRLYQPASATDLRCQGCIAWLARTP